MNFPNYIHAWYKRAQKASKALTILDYGRAPCSSCGLRANANKMREWAELATSAMD